VGDLYKFIATIDPQID